ncbi:hypothetical protein D3C77_492250 [compost metagenome]
MDGEIVYRSMGGSALFEGLQMLNKQVIIEGEWMIIVNNFPFGEAKMRMVFVIVILRYESHFVCSTAVNDRAGYCCFTGAGAAGDTNNEHVDSETSLK